MNLNQEIIFAIGKKWMNEYNVDRVEVQSMFLSNVEEFATLFIFLKLSASVVMEFISKGD